MTVVDHTQRGEVTVRDLSKSFTLNGQRLNVLRDLQLDVIDGHPVQGVGKERAIIFQEPRLLPWLTVLGNVAFGLTVRGLPQAKAWARARHYIHLVGLAEFETAYPRQLSGGMAQRVSLGRTLCYNPDLILMDEPFGALDYFTRKKLQREIVDLFLTEQKTIVFVTHDVSEAVYLGQKILVMEAGQLIREVSVDLPYPRQVADPAFLQYQQEILDVLGGV